MVDPDANWMAANYTSIGSLLAIWLPGALTVAMYTAIWLRIAFRNRKLYGGRVSTQQSWTSQPQSQQQQRGNKADRAKKSLRLMTLIFLVNLAMLAPGNVLYQLGLKSALVKWSTALTVVVESMFFGAIAINPVVYALVSRDMRSAFQRTLRCQ